VGTKPFAGKAHTEAETAAGEIQTEAEKGDGQEKAEEAAEKGGLLNGPGRVKKGKAERHETGIKQQKRFKRGKDQKERWRSQKVRKKKRGVGGKMGEGGSGKEDSIQG